LFISWQFLLTFGSFTNFLEATKIAAEASRGLRFLTRSQQSESSRRISPTFIFCLLSDLGVRYTKWEQQLFTYILFWSNAPLFMGNVLVSQMLGLRYLQP
jgi:hypothetical protein